MLKPFHSRAAGQEPGAGAPTESLSLLSCVAVPVASTSLPVSGSKSDGLLFSPDGAYCGRLPNSELLSQLESHLRSDLINLVSSYPS